MNNVLYPKDAGESLLFQVVKRCTNCITYDSCEKLKEMKKKYRIKALASMINGTNCRQFNQGETMIVDDDRDIGIIMELSS